MPKAAHKTPMSATGVKAIREPGRYGEGRGGHGLYLRVYRRADGGLAKSWGQRISIRGKRTNLGLGAYPVVTLAGARAKALHNRREVEAGRDPRGDGIPTFEKAAEKVIRLHARSWKDAELMARRWRQNLRAYAYPVFGSKRVSKIAAADVLEALAPIWSSKPAAAKMARQRIGAVMKWAIASGYRTDNPAGEAVAAALPRQNGRTRHHAAMRHREVAAALAKIRSAKGRNKAARLAFEFAALTAARSGEVRGARWCEIDREAGIWTIPPERMKAKREHRIPLSTAALDVLHEARALGSAVFVFPSRKTGRPLSPKPLQLLANLTGATVHGLRSSFRIWAGDNAVAPEVAGRALAHVVRGVAGAYDRGSLFERRRAVMQDWGEYIMG